MEYKEFILIENYKQLNGEKSVIENFNNNFTKNKAKIEIKDTNLIIKLKEIDISKLHDLYESNRHQLLHKIIYKIESIKSYGINNGKRNYINYNKERKVVGRKNKEKKRGIHYYTQGNNFSETNVEIPKKYENKIINGDSLKVLKKLPDNCVDLVFTSPPYNFGLDYENDKDDDNKWNDYFERLFLIFDQCVRVLKFGGRIIVNTQPLFSDYIPSHHIISNYFIKKKLIWKGEILWEKNNYNCKYTAWGSWRSPSSPYLKYTWEFLEVFCKGTLKHEGDAKNIDISAEEFKEFVVAKWSIAPERNMKTYDHPAMFPEKLVERVLKLFSFKNDVILDPFNGVGTTTAVSKKVSRRYLGIDISNKYCEIAKKRTSNMLIENKLFI